MIADEEERFNFLRYYKVHWTEVPDLVGKRQVFFKNGNSLWNTRYGSSRRNQRFSGYAFVPQADLISIIHSRFRANLSKNLAIGEVTASFDILSTNLPRAKNASKCYSR